jgi:hypothetical protein
MAGRGPSPKALATQRAASTPPPAAVVVRPRPPRGLAAAGKGLWTRMHEDLADDQEFSAKELELLRRACQLADREAGLQKIIDRDGLMTTGSTGQVVLHPAAQELRQVETALCGLLARISTEDTGGEVATPRQERAAKAGRARWAKHNVQKLERERLARG